MTRVLVDTDVLIDLLRGRPVTRAFLLQITGEATACCSAVTVAELHAGMREAERDATTDVIDGLIVFPVTREIAEVAGTLRRRAGKTAPPIADCLIAATAIVEAVSLATRDVRHFRFPGITVLAAP